MTTEQTNGASSPSASSAGLGAEGRRMELIDRMREADRDSVQRLHGSRIFGEAADEIERLRGIAVESRSSVRLDLENYERVLDDMNRSDQQRTAAYEAVSKERTRLFRLLAKIDALVPPNAKLCGAEPQAERPNER